jgi:putative DNA primase/helicase
MPNKFQWSCVEAIALTLRGVPQWRGGYGMRPGTRAEAQYLAGRSITIPLPPSLRWAPGCLHPNGIRLPAMVAKVVNNDGELIGIHRTFLTADYRRRDRASLGPVGGGAVRLAAPAETLLIGEGIETCLAAMQATSMAAWAALSTSGMTVLLLPSMVRNVIILADHDENGAGARAAWLAADRRLAEGRRVWIAMPPQSGTDFNDVMLGRGYEPKPFPAARRSPNETSRPAANRAACFVSCPHGALT